MTLKTQYQKLSQSLNNFQDVSLLLMRLVLAYGFFNPAKTKLSNFSNIVEWFDSINIPLPTLNAFLATATESFGVILLFLGLGTRIIAFPLIITMIVAIVTVHLGNGFEAGNNGFEIPLYYLIMLFTLMVYGSGRFSVDQLLNKTKDE